MLTRKILIAIHRKRLMNSTLNYNNGAISLDEYKSIQIKELCDLQKLEKIDLGYLIKQVTELEES